MTPDQLDAFIAADPWFDSKGHSWVLYGICRAYARTFGAIRALEIGTRAGSTAVPMIAGLLAGDSNARLVSVDNNTDLDAHALSDARMRIGLLGLSEFWELHQADSRTWQSPHGEYHVIFIDGDHSYEGVRADFHRFSVLLAEHGIILMHDAEDFPDIRRFLPEILNCEQWMTSVLPFYNGMAIVRRRSDWNLKKEYVEDRKW